MAPYRLVPIRDRLTILGSACIAAGLGFLLWLLAR